MDTGPIIILANDQKCCYYQSSIQYIARIITTILHHNRDTTVDIVVRYEGERAICEICDALDRGRKLENVKGISFRHDNRVFSTPLRHRIENLDSIPFPAFHLLEPSIEHYIGEGKEKGFPIITTRGCPFNCIFCSTAALHGRKYRTRSANNVLDEMEFVQDKYKINVISFADDNFTMKRNRVIELCRGIKERNLDFEWGCSARVDLLSKDLFLNVIPRSSLRLG